jgi:hypothetical protein
MAYIEGRGQRTKSNQPPCFTKQSLNELELGIRTLADNCKTVKVCCVNLSIYFLLSMFRILTLKLGRTGLLLLSIC